jgi:hypothetical protein
MIAVIEQGLYPGQCFVFCQAAKVETGIGIAGLQCKAIKRILIEVGHAAASVQVRQDWRRTKQKLTKAQCGALGTSSGNESA